MKVEDVKKVAIFGAGTMGTGLAQVFAVEGYEVALYSRTKETLDKSRTIAETNLKTFVEHGLIKQEEVEPTLARIKPTQSVEEAATEADFVIESIAEKMDMKKVLYEQLDAICPEHTIFTSNTSYLNIYSVMPEKRLPQTVIAHWFAPPHVIPLVEVVKGEQTSQETTDFVVEFLKKVDKAPVVLEKFVDGFVVNRFLRILGREVFFLLDNGFISPEDLDLAVKTSIIPRAMVLGFVQRYDFTGLDLSYTNLQNPNYWEGSIDPIDNQPKSLKEAVDRGDMGVKSGKGFFDYSDRPLAQVLKERDDALIKVFAENKELIKKHI